MERIINATSSPVVTTGAQHHCIGTLRSLRLSIGDIASIVKMVRIPKIPHPMIHIIRIASVLIILAAELNSGVKQSPMMKASPQLVEVTRIQLRSSR